MEFDPRPRYARQFLAVRSSTAELRLTQADILSFPLSNSTPISAISNSGGPQLTTMRTIKTTRASHALRVALQTRTNGSVRLPGRALTVSLGNTSRSLSSTTALAPTLQQHRPTPLSSSQSQSYQPNRHASSSAAPASSPLGKTALYDLHLSHGAKMVPFGGYHMPVQYAGQSVAASHAFTRSHASLFDVGHMVQRMLRGPGAALLLQRLTPLDARSLPVGRGSLSCLLHEGTGGVVDDTIVTRLAGEGDGGDFYIVTNAACREKDDAHLDRELEKWNSEEANAELQVEQEILEGWGLVALQGPRAAEVLAEALAEPDEVRLGEVLFGQVVHAKLKIGRRGTSSPLLISRGGYTGEDGFEISIPPAETLRLTETLLATGGPERVQLAGLGARDSLRLEAGLCLYGHDLDNSTTPVEAGLSWIVPKERRTADAGFYGAEVISRQLVPKSKGGSGVRYRRVGLVVEGAPAREDAQIWSRPAAEGEEGENLGSVTSGCPSPTLGKNIAMGYVKDGFHKAGTELDVLIRGKRRKAVVTKMPFVPTKYYKGTAPA